MARPKLISFPFYPTDFLGDHRVQAMSTLEVGAYMLLLCAAWQEEPRGTLPDDLELLRRWSRMSKDEWHHHCDRICDCFPLGDDGRRFNPRLKRVAAEIADYAERRAESGRRGAEARWQGHRFANANALRPQCASNGLQSQIEEEKNTSPSETCGAPPKRPRQPPVKPHPQAVATFVDAWAAKYGDRYPFNGGKDGAAVKWCLAQLNGDLARWAEVVAAYLADGSAFVADARHSLGVLRATFARYQVSSPGQAGGGGVVGALNGWLNGQGGPRGRTQ